MPVTSTSRPISRRDKFAWTVMTFVLDHIATRHYAQMISGAIHYGLESAVRDEMTGAMSPTDDLESLRLLSSLSTSENPDDEDRGDDAHSGG